MSINPLGDAKHFRSRRQSGHTWRHFARSESAPKPVDVRHPCGAVVCFDIALALTDPNHLDRVDPLPYSGGVCLAEEKLGLLARRCPWCCPRMRGKATLVWLPMTSW